MQSTAAQPEATIAVVIPRGDHSPTSTVTSQAGRKRKVNCPQGISLTTTRPQKPREDFPLFPHANGRWAKKIRGKFVYFGRWADDPRGERAMLKWLEEKDELLAGRTPRPRGSDGQPTVKYICDSYLCHQKQKRDNGDIRPASFRECFQTCLRIAAAFGRGRLVSDLGPPDFASLRKSLSKIRGCVSLKIEMQRVRSVFRFAYEDGKIAVPVRFGVSFKPPSAKTLRLHRQNKGRMDLQSDQIRALIELAKVPMRAMIMLGINAGFGNGDVGTLPLSAVDLAGGWIDYRRSKTGSARRCRLWPETQAALRAAIDERPTPKDKADAKLCFVTIHGNAWAKESAGNDPVNTLFSRLLRDLGFYRAGLGFYSLRRSFRTVADGVLDKHAVDLVMGHVSDANDMGRLYTQAIDDSRLEAVSAHVRRWLFPAKRRAR